MINEEKKATDEILDSHLAKTTTSKIRHFTDSLVSQSSLMKKLLEKKASSKGKNTFRDQLSQKFDKLFNMSQNTERAVIIPKLRQRHGPRLYIHKPQVVM